MSIWWAKRNQLDEAQVNLIEDLPLRENQLVLGSPGSGKTNVLLRRAQFVRGQNMPNILVLTFTRPLTEFIKTGCVNAQGKEIFPKSLVTTIEKWIRNLYRIHAVSTPVQSEIFDQRKIDLAKGAMNFSAQKKIPLYDAVFVDEAQDLIKEEVDLIKTFSNVIFFVGDDRQRIYGGDGISEIRKISPKINESTLPYHYRLAPEICAMADKILVAQGSDSLSSTCQYSGPKPGHIEVHGPLSRINQLSVLAENIKGQTRAYGDMIKQGDRLGIIVPTMNDREIVFNFLEGNQSLRGQSKIIRSNSGGSDDRDYDPTFDPEHPIIILTEKGCKGLEFRAVHWLFCDQNTHRKTEDYYTTVTRAKTSLDIYHDNQLPPEIAKSHSVQITDIWE